jgi:hypothetical protein
MNDVRAGSQKQGVAIGRRLGDIVAADDPVDAAAVFDDDILPEALAEFWCDDFGDESRGTTTRKRHDEVDGSVGIGRCLHVAEERDQDEHPAFAKQCLDEGRRAQTGSLQKEKA